MQSLKQIVLAPRYLIAALRRSLLAFVSYFLGTSLVAISPMAFSHLLCPRLTSVPKEQASSSKRTALVSAVKKAGQTAGTPLSPGPSQ